MNASSLDATRSPEMQGRRALVTGAGSGIGLAVACALAARGARVAGVVQHAAQAEALRHHLPDAAVFVQDLLEDAATAALPQRAAQALGGLDALACCAGIFFKKGSDDTALDEWRATLELNLNATFVLTRAAIAAMRTGVGAAGEPAAPAVGGPAAPIAADDRSVVVISTLVACSIRSAYLLPMTAAMVFTTIMPTTNTATSVKACCIPSIAVAIEISEPAERMMSTTSIRLIDRRVSSGSSMARRKRFPTRDPSSARALMMDGGMLKSAAARYSQTPVRRTPTTRTT